MIRYLCDICGKETKGRKVAFVTWDERDTTYSGTYPHVETKSFDVCEECEKKVEDGWYSLKNAAREESRDE